MVLKQERPLVKVVDKKSVNMAMCHQKAPTPLALMTREYFHFLCKLLLELTTKLLLAIRKNIINICLSIFFPEEKTFSKHSVRRRNRRCNDGGSPSR